QELGGQFVAIRSVGIGRNVVADLGARSQHRQLDGKCCVPRVRKLRAQGPIELEVGIPAAAVTDDNGTAWLLSLGVKSEKFVAILLLEPNRLTDQDRGQDLVRPAFLA